MNPLEKYLTQYAEPEVALARALPTRNWDYALLIPAYRESPAFFGKLKESLLAHHQVLLILVVNQPDSEPHPHPLNHQLHRLVIGESRALSESANMALRQIKGTNSTVLLVDRFSPGNTIPRREGVGLARKIGADIATFMIHQQQVASPWIFSTDADTDLPTDYFTAVEPAGGNACALYPFQHRCHDNAVGHATQLYEISLNYYVAGLDYAGSPYAFHTIGSTLAFDYRVYAKARGFPKRAGGEDFYLLNKLAKLGGICRLKAPTLNIEARHSDRVPFGTGPAIGKILDSNSVASAPLFYHPHIFDELRHWLTIAPNLLSNPSRLSELSDNVHEVILNLGVEKMLIHGNRQCKTTAQFERHLHTWFDGFRTLKFIHGLREMGFANRTLDNLGKIPWFTEPPRYAQT